LSLAHENIVYILAIKKTDANIQDP
jgi:hypothetical protein